MAGLSKEDFDAWVRRYFNDPVGFVLEVLGADPYPWQKDFLWAVARGDRNIAVASGHRVGKSTVLGWVCIWYALTRVPFKIGITAPTSGQLNDAMFAEMRQWIQRLPSGLQGLLDVKSDRIDLVASGGTSFVVVKTGRVEQPEALAGLHSLNTLLIGDEASGIPDAVFDSSTSSMAAPNAQMVLCGNPLRSVGYFANCFTEWSDRWTCFTVSSEDCPNVSKDWIEEKKLEYGEESNQYRARVLGLFPRGDDDTIIPLEMVTSAVGREVIQAPNVEEVWGLDVAEKGSNASALCRRKGRVVPVPVELFRGLELMQLVGRVKGIWEATPLKLRPVEINVDGNGMGSGVAGRLAELGLPIRSVVVSELPAIGGTNQIFFNLRSELWWKARHWFSNRDVSIPKDDRLISDLTKIRFDTTEGRSDLLKAESKKAMLKRKVQSPDSGDSFIMTFAGIAGIANGSSFGGKYRNKPIQRRIKGTSFV